MKLKAALAKLENFRLKVKAAENLDGVQGLVSEFYNSIAISELFTGESLEQITLALDCVRDEIEQTLVKVLNQFLQKLHDTKSLDSIATLLLEYKELNTVSISFKGVDRARIEPLRAEMMVTLKQTLTRLTPQKPPCEPKQAAKTEYTEPKMNASKTEFVFGNSGYVKINLDRQLALIKVRKNITIMRKKITELQNEGVDTAASLAAKKLCDDITVLAAHYEREKISLYTFKEQANSAIEESHIELDKPRGYCVKHILANLAFAILTLVVGYLILAAYKGTFFAINPNTDSANLVDMVDYSVDDMALAG